MTAVAHATGGSEVIADGGRPPTQGQVGESWHHRPAAANQQTFAGALRRPPTKRSPLDNVAVAHVTDLRGFVLVRKRCCTGTPKGQVGEPWHPRLSPPTPLAEPDGQPKWPVASLAVLAAVLVLAGGLAAKQASHRTRIGHAA
jgi:hypothetical protein